MFRFKSVVREKFVQLERSFLIASSADDNADASQLSGAATFEHGVGDYKSTSAIQDGLLLLSQGVDVAQSCTTSTKY